MRTMVAIVLGAAVTAALALSSGAMAKPTRDGKVVRIERPRTFERTTLRVCHMEMQMIGQAACYGSVPDVDDEAEVYNLGGYQGRVRVTDVKPQPGNQCGGESAGEVYFEYIDGSGVIDSSASRLVVFGGGMDSTVGKSAPDPYGIPAPSANLAIRPSWRSIATATALTISCRRSTTA